MSIRQSVDMKWGVYDTCMEKQQCVCKASDLRIGDFFVNDPDSWIMAVRLRVTKIEDDQIICQEFFKGESGYNGHIIGKNQWVHYLEGENEQGLPNRGDEWIKETWKEIDKNG